MKRFQDLEEFIVGWLRTSNVNPADSYSLWKNVSRFSQAYTATTFVNSSFDFEHEKRAWSGALSTLGAPDNVIEYIMGMDYLRVFDHTDSVGNPVVIGDPGQDRPVAPNAGSDRQNGHAAGY